jgi:hypothetical protein
MPPACPKRVPWHINHVHARVLLNLLLRRYASPDGTLQAKMSTVKRMQVRAVRFLLRAGMRSVLRGIDVMLLEKRGMNYIF